MKFKVRPYLTLRKAMGNKAVIEMEAGSATIRSVLSDLVNRFGDDFSTLMFDPKTKELSSHIKVLVNGRHFKYLPNKLDTELADGDEVALFPPVAGG
jgi:molybdopterin synthase sulfur carrier subunit